MMASERKLPRLLLVAMFLTPYARISVVSGYGLSVGDVLLALGGATLMMTLPRKESCRHHLAVFGVPGALIVPATIGSGLANQSSSLSDIVRLATQYAFILVFLPAVLSRLSADQLVTAVKAFLYGMASSVLVGLVIMTSLPGVYTRLEELGFMVALGDGRPGLFSGVGELAKVPAMCIPLLYWLAARRAITIRSGSLLLACFMLGIVVARSGAGLLVGVASLTALATLHYLLRGRLRRSTFRGIGIKSVGTLLIGLLAGSILLSHFDQVGSYVTNFSARVLTPLTTSGLESVGSGQQRLLLVNEAWRIIGNQPLLGVGPGLYPTYAASGEDVHAVPLMMWAETGILTAVAWLLLIFLFGIAVTSVNRRFPVASIAAGSIGVAFVVMNFSVPYMYGRDLFMPFLFAFFILKLPSFPSYPGVRSTSKQAAGARNSAMQYAGKVATDGVRVARWRPPFRRFASDV